MSGSGRDRLEVPRRACPKPPADVTWLYRRVRAAAARALSLLPLPDAQSLGCRGPGPGRADARVRDARDRLSGPAEPARLAFPRRVQPVDRSRTAFALRARSRGARERGTA